MLTKVHPNESVYDWVSEKNPAVNGSFLLFKDSAGNGFVSNYRIVNAHDRNKGYGTEMMKELLREAAKLNFPAVVLDVLRNNTPAVHVYLNCGFVIDESRRENSLTRRECSVWWLKYDFNEAP